VVYRIAQISDTHLSRDKPLFVANFERVAAHVAALRPDLVVNTGDMALDGVIRPDDLVEARRLHDACELPVRFIPGNHDIGDSQDVPNRHGPAISDESRERYVRLFGRDFWLLDVPSWRILAIDAQLLGSDLAAAEEQLEFIAAAAAEAGPRSLALLVHKPLYHRSPDEDAITGRFLNPPARRQLLEALGGREPALVARSRAPVPKGEPADGAARVAALDGLRPAGRASAALRREANRLRRARAGAGRHPHEPIRRGGRTSDPRHHGFPRGLRPHAVRLRCQLDLPTLPS
jgi:hypothetical protein